MKLNQSLAAEPARIVAMLETEIAQLEELSKRCERKATNLPTLNGN